MPLDLTDFNKFMSQFLPILLQQKMEKQRVERWLNKTLEEYKAWEATQGRLQESGAEHAIRELLIKSGAKGAEGLDRPLMALLSRLGEAGVKAPGIPTVSPEQYGTAIQPYADLMPALGRQLEAGQYPSKEEMTIFTRLMGSENVQEWLKELEKTVGGRAERTLRGEEIEVERGKTALGWAEVGVKEKGLETKKEARKKLDKLYIEREKYVEKHTGIGAPMMSWRPHQRKFIVTKLESINKKIKGLEKHLGIESTLPTEEDYKKFEVMARESIKRGIEINWNAAMMQGFRPSWLLQLKKKLGIVEPK